MQFQPDEAKSDLWICYLLQHAARMLHTNLPEDSLSRKRIP